MFGVTLNLLHFVKPFSLSSREHPSSVRCVLFGTYKAYTAFVRSEAEQQTLTLFMARAKSTPTYTTVASHTSNTTLSVADFKLQLYHFVTRHDQTTVHYNNSISSKVRFLKIGLLN